jgi:1,2-phenylacetyl-CoA epoxidase catalytic subunit
MRDREQGNDLDHVQGNDLDAQRTAAASAAAVSSRAQLAPETASMLEQMMESHAYRELAAARLFGHGLQFVPELRWLKFLTWHIREETEHYEAVARMYGAFAGRSVEPVVHARLSRKPIPFAESWFELAMAQFLFDRAGFWQLREYEECAFLPYRSVVRKILVEEAGHQELGARIVRNLSQRGRCEGDAQVVFEKWYLAGMLSFGRPGTEGARRAVAARLKKRDPGEVMRDFVEDIAPVATACGLRLPDPNRLGIDAPRDLRGAARPGRLDSQSARDEPCERERMAPAPRSRPS